MLGVELVRIKIGSYCLGGDDGGVVHRVSLACDSSSVFVSLRLSARHNFCNQWCTVGYVQGSGVGAHPKLVVNRRVEVFDVKIT